MMDGNAARGAIDAKPSPPDATKQQHRDAIRILPIQPASPQGSSFAPSMDSPHQLSLDAILMSTSAGPGTQAAATRNGSDTPSSTVVEFGDIITKSHSAAELVGGVFRPRSRARSAFRADGKDGRGDRPHSNTRGAPKPEGHKQEEGNPAPGRRAVSRPKEPSRETGNRSPERVGDNTLGNERVNAFLQSMAQPTTDTDRGLMMENRGLYQRVAALQRVERDLLAETQVLSRQLATQKQHHNVRRQHYKDELRKTEIQVRELEAKLRGSEQPQPSKLEPLLSDGEIQMWFEVQEKAWHSWAQDFSHRNPARLTTGLHPMQLRELSDTVCGFVQLTDEGKLPPDLWTGGADAARTLLHGMLVNFICAEVFTTPFWVFNAISPSVGESPATMSSGMKPLTPGYRVDLGLFSDISPIRPNLATPGSPHYPPKLITSMMPTLGIASSQSLPGRYEMDNLYQLLIQAQPDDAELSHHEWRAHVMRLFAQGGMDTTNPASAGRNAARRTLIESRLSHGRRLKDRFLGTSARFLLHEQDVDGMENLESALSTLLDDALRFSCRLWSRDTPVRVHGWKELGLRKYHSRDDVMVLCYAQQPTPSCSPDDGTSSSPRLETVPVTAKSFAEAYEGRPVIMVVQPAIETIRVRGDDDEPPPRLWLKARVLVATPQRARAPAPIAIGPALALPPSTSRSLIETPSEMTRDNESPSTTKGEASTPATLGIPKTISPGVASASFPANERPSDGMKAASQEDAWLPTTA